MLKIRRSRDPSMKNIYSNFSLSMPASNIEPVNAGDFDTCQTDIHERPQSRSRDRLIFNMGIPILVRPYPYIETCLRCVLLKVVHENKNYAGVNHFAWMNNTAFVVTMASFKHSADIFAFYYIFTHQLLYIYIYIWNLGPFSQVATDKQWRSTDRQYSAVPL